MTYPEVAEIEGVEYRINTGYEFALACFSCINDPDISDIERAYGVVGILYADEIPDNHIQKALEIAIKYLQCGKEKKTSGVPDMDFEQDEEYIKASFLSDYKIDLDETDLHWYKFCILLQGLSDKCALNRVRDLRNYDTSDIKDGKTIAKIMRAKQSVALKPRLTAQDKEIIDEFESTLPPHLRLKR